MNTPSASIRRELRVAFSPRGQPVWFRVLKWTCLLIGAILYHRTNWFWWCIAALALAGLFLHVLYRWQTKVWTRPWGGWDDLAAGRR